MMKLISKKPLFRLQKHYWDQAYLSVRKKADKHKALWCLLLPHAKPAQEGV